VGNKEKVNPHGKKGKVIIQIKELLQLRETLGELDSILLIFHGKRFSSSFSLYFGLPAYIFWHPHILEAGELVSTCSLA